MVRANLVSSAMTALLKYWYLVAIAGLVLALAAASVRLADEKAAHAKTKQANAEVLRDLAQKTSAAYKSVLAYQQAQQTRLSELDSRYTKEIQNAKHEIAGLESDIRSGRSRLRIAATCPGASPNLPEATGTASVDDAAAPRLTHAAELGYFDVRRAWAQAATQIEGLQGYITEVCLAQK